MIKGPTTPFEIPPEMRAFAEQSVEQAKVAFDKFMAAAQTTMSTFEGQSKAAQASAKDVGAKTMAYAEQNITSAFDYAQKLLHAKDPQAVMEIHSEFIRTQMQALSEQAKVFGESAKTVMDSVRPKT